MLSLENVTEVGRTLLLLLLRMMRRLLSDHENTNFTCPFRAYAFRRMSFGLCNAPATFQKCMISIFSYLVR